MTDHLGEAAKAKHASKQAVREKRYNDAWTHLQSQQDEWTTSATQRGFTPQQLLNLLSPIWVDRANIHRLEGNHRDALATIMYAVASTNRPTKADAAKVSSYFKRCKFKAAKEPDLKRAMSAIKRDPDIRLAQECVREWQ
ncbi:hypothetical protein [Halomonas sp. 707B3]|uniref:hypothetical protein n=1 Tax=Halomonas sp. 707B3 TaxID=1681043 RepID=UPI00209D799D|nr:hypothetical protein [Halomonas sp. 707B3]MCP1316349.1 hypothetical protein [Halomonas sp. 707B3]